MQVILKKNVVGLGEEGDIVNVKAGYARNYLLPHGFVVEKTDNNLRILEKTKEEILARKESIAKESQDLKTKIEDLVIELERQVVEGNKLYGSVTGKDLVDQLETREISVKKQNIEMPGHIKMLGEYIIPVRMSDGTKADLRLLVKPLSE